MAVSILEYPYTDNINYFVNGVLQTGLNQKINTSLDPTDTPLEFTLTTNQFIFGFPPYYKSYIVFNNTNTGNTPVTISPGDTVNIKGEIFTAAIAPEDGEFYSVNAGATVIEKTRAANSLADAINQNLNLSPLYFAQAYIDTPNNVYGVQIDSAYFGLIYNLYNNTPGPQQLLINFAGINDADVWTLDPIQFSFDGNFGQRLQAFDYGVFLEVWEYRQGTIWGRRPTSNDANKLAELTLPYNVDNIYTFDISKILKSELSTVIVSRNLLVNDIGRINFDNGTPISIKPYFLKYGEKFSGGILSNGAPAEDPTQKYVRKYFSITNAVATLRWASPGAYQFNLSADTPQAPIYWQHTIENVSTNAYRNVKRLTKEPQYKLRRRYEKPEIIYFYVHNDEQFQQIRHYRVKNTFYKQTSTFTDITISHITPQFNQSGLIWFDLAPSKCGFNASDNAAPVQYSEHVLQVSYSTTNGNSFFDYSDVFSYEWDLNTEPFYNTNGESKYFKLWWKNSLGVYDQFEFEGQQIRTMSADFSNYEKGLTNTNFNLITLRKDGVNLRYNAKVSYEITINTGWINYLHMEWLKEIIKSNEWYTDDIFQYFDLNLEISNRATWNALLLDGFEFQEDPVNKLFNLSCKFIYSIPENTISA